VDDGSTDDTSAVVQNLGRRLAGIRLIRYAQNRGKGYAVRTGCLASKGNILLISDADLSTPIEEIEKLLPFIDAGFDVVIGSRGLPGSEIEVRQPWHREKMGKTFNLLVKLLAIGGIKDTQCGFKLLEGAVARDLFARSLIEGFSFDVEILFLAARSGRRIKEVPIKWLDSPNSRVRLLRHPLQMMLDLFRVRAYALSGRYDRTKPHSDPAPPDADEAFRIQAARDTGRRDRV
jgi:dolichyl-phosphate beta-glucosyltransferase